VANGVTTGGEVLRSGVAAVVFALVATIGQTIIERSSWSRADGRVGRFASVAGRTVVATVGVGGIVAMFVGLVMLLTNTSFGTPN
jgi:hypothetical protein